LDVTQFEPKLPQHPVQGAGLQLVFRIPDDCELLTEEKCPMAAFPTTRNVANRQVPLFAGFLDKPDELRAFHFLVIVSDNFVRVSSPVFLSMFGFARRGADQPSRQENHSFVE
jgi:hypothetical protein